MVSNCKPFILLKKKTQQLAKYVSSLETTKLELLGNLFVRCTCTKVIVINKEPKYLVPHNISTNPIINSVSNLYEIEERLIAPRQAFAQIWHVEGYGQYKIRGSVCNVPTNVNRTQLILPCMLNDEATFGFLLKDRLKYKSLYLLGNI
jgi:hypothetical protein